MGNYSKKNEAVAKVFSRNGRNESKERDDLKTITLSERRFSGRVHYVKL